MYEPAGHENQAWWARPNFQASRDWVLSKNPMPDPTPIIHISAGSSKLIPGPNAMIARDNASVVKKLQLCE
jgi:hypothetical protein